MVVLPIVVASMEAFPVKNVLHALLRGNPIERRWPMPAPTTQPETLPTYNWDCSRSCISKVTWVRGRLGGYVADTLCWLRQPVSLLPVIVSSVPAVSVEDPLDSGLWVAAFEKPASQMALRRATAALFDVALATWPDGMLSSLSWGDLDLV
jgi:hypothetical protein